MLYSHEPACFYSLRSSLSQQMGSHDDCSLSRQEALNVLDFPLANRDGKLYCVSL